MALPQGKVDLAVVGGGIIGLATAREFLQRHPDWRVVVLEKEDTLATHQSGHNSGVIHAGIYYKPGSLKAKACVAGHREIMAFCDARGIPYRRCGKLIVALDESELPRLHDIYERGLINGCAGLETVGPERMREIEPHAAGIKAIYSPNTGVIDFTRVAQVYADDIAAGGGEIITGCTVRDLVSRADTTTVVTTLGDFDARYVITCAGLYSDRISRAEELRVVPFRGSYYRLRPDKRYLVNALIYPVPDPRFPFLGVHFTRTMDDDVWVGPNAVLAFAREGYRRWQINIEDMRDTLTYPGFWKLALKYWRMGALEMFRDYVKNAYVKTAQRYLPELHAGDLLDGPSGVRAQALGTDGALVDDFRIKRGENVVHVQNAPSPAATSSLVVARMIADAAAESFSHMDA